MGIRITIIGGGSSTFVPQLMRLFLGSKVLAGGTIVLMDVDAQRLEVMDRLCRLLVESQGADLAIESTQNRREALAGANYVITAISVGGMDAWEQDIEIPARYGVTMAIADSVGPGGIMRALRHIPVLAGMVDDVAEVAPDAWVFNYSNPLSSIVTALTRHRPEVKTVGLCTCVSIPRNAAYLANWAGVAPDALALPAPGGGLNHCAFMTDLRLTDGSPVFPRILERTELPVVRWALEQYGLLPYCWSHVTEFFPSLSVLAEPYEGMLQGLEMKYGLHVHAMAHERERGEHWATLANEWAAGTPDDVSLDVLPGAEAIEVVEIIEALATGENTLVGVNMPNRGAIANLPDDAIIEATSLVGAYGIRPIQLGVFPEALAAIWRQHITVQQLTAEAALTGDYGTLRQAFSADPQVQARLSMDDIEPLLRELMAAHADHLPQFE